MAPPPRPRRVVVVSQIPRCFHGSARRCAGGIPIHAAPALPPLASSQANRPMGVAYHLDTGGRTDFPLPSPSPGPRTRDDGGCLGVRMRVLSVAGFNLCAALRHGRWKASLPSLAPARVLDSLDALATPSPRSPPPNGDAALDGQTLTSGSSREPAYCMPTYQALLARPSSASKTSTRCHSTQVTKNHSLGSHTHLGRQTLSGRPCAG